MWGLPPFYLDPPSDRLVIRDSPPAFWGEPTGRWGTAVTYASALRSGVGVFGWVLSGFRQVSVGFIFCVLFFFEGIVFFSWEGSLARYLFTGERYGTLQVLQCMCCFGLILLAMGVRAGFVWWVGGGGGLPRHLFTALVAKTHPRLT